MIEATSSVHQAQLRATAAIRASMSIAVRVLARQRAIKAVKLALQREGRRKVSQIAMREIVAMANAYLPAHRSELLAEARPIVEQWRREGFFGKKAALSVRNVHPHMLRHSTGYKLANDGARYLELGALPWASKSAIDCALHCVGP